MKALTSVYKTILSAILLVLILTQGAYSQVQELAVEKAKTYLQVREKNNLNDSPEISTFLNYVGLPQGSPYCMAFVSYSYYLAAKDFNTKSPVPKFGAVNQIYNHASKNPVKFRVIRTLRLSAGIEKAESGDILVFRKGPHNVNFDKWKGHTGLIIRQISNSRYETIEGNTAASNSGDQRGEGNKNKREHDGVYIKTRGVSLGSNFPLVALIRVK